MTTIRRLLTEAKRCEGSGPRLHRNGPIGTVKRKHLIQEAKLLASRYSLGDRLDEMVYAAGCEALTGLNLDELEVVVSKLRGLGARLDVGCDPPELPPAR
ncbi:MAG: hypothetical protein GAK28_00730 [Luteibacter sp.]|nr:MAG: hypothetical protein GAK28_00730 [Luteibacter sp.]